MANTLLIDRVAVEHLADGRLVHGLLFQDEYECDAVLCLELALEVPVTLRGLVALCREEHRVNALGMLERCVEEGCRALLDGQAVDLAELAAVMAESGDD